MFKFELKRKNKNNNKKFDLDFDDEFENWNSLIYKSCDIIEENNLANFYFQGFNLKWSLDIRYDFMTFIEQIPNLGRFIKEKSLLSSFILSLYEQGTERDLHLKFISKDCIELYVTTLGCQDILGEKEVIEVDDFSKMIKHVLVEYVNILDSNFTDFFKLGDVKINWLNPLIECDLLIHND